MKHFTVVLAIALLLVAGAAALPDHEPGHVVKGSQLDQQRHSASGKDHAHPHPHPHPHEHAHSHHHD